MQNFLTRLIFCSVCFLYANLVFAQQSLYNDIRLGHSVAYLGKLVDQKSISHQQKVMQMQQQIESQNLLITNNDRSRTLMIIVLGFALFVAAISYRNNEKNKKLIGIISAQKHELEIAVQTKDRIFSLISHDMRAPVSTMIAFTQLLEYDEVPQENLRKYTIQLKKSLNHTSVLIDNLLNWSSSQMQGFKPFLEICDIGLLVTDVISTLQAQASAKKIVIVNNIPLGMLITADINMAQLVLRNLISNAVKFSYEDGAIDLNAKAYGDKVELSVYDKGMGMSEELVEQFNTNSQLQFVESTLGTHKEKGTGLGLVLCKNFTTLMQGEIFVESQEGQGTTCYVALPNGS